MIKNKKAKSTWYFDTPEGVDHMLNTMRDHSDHKWTAKEHEENEKLKRDTKLGLIKDEEKKLKKFDNADPSTYPSDPEQTRILTNIKAHEDSLGIRQDTWKRFVKTGSLPLAPKEKQLSTWELMKATGTPEEKREYAKMERDDQRKDNMRKLEEKRERIKQYRAKQEIKQKKSAPAVAMAKEIVETVQEQAKTIATNNPILDKTPVYVSPVSRAFTGGLHENFVNEKIKQGEILKQIEKEIKNEEV